MTTWQAEFIDWHLRTEHPWDMALHMEALTLGALAIATEIHDRLLPTVEKAAESLRRLMDSMPHVTLGTWTPDGIL